MTAPQLFDRTALLTRRTRAARGASLPDFLLHRAAEDIAARLHTVKRSFERELCLGAYHGVLAEALLSSSNPPAEVICMEASGPLLARCPGGKVCGDEEWLPFRDASFDLVVSALSLQFVNDLPGALVQIRRALKPDGLFMGAIIGGATLAELREAFMLAELEIEGGASPRVAPMADVRDCGALLQRAGFTGPVADVDGVEVTYVSALALMRELRGMGATNVLAARRKTFLKRATLTRAAEIYQERFPAGGSRVRASFEIIHMTGWAPSEGERRT